MNLNFAPSEIRRSRKRCARYIETHERLAGEVAVVPRYGRDSRGGGVMASIEKKTIKFQMMMSPAEAKRLDDWMFANRLRSRAEAIRRLVDKGFDACEQEAADAS